MQISNIYPHFSPLNVLPNNKTNISYTQTASKQKNLNTQQPPLNFTGAFNPPIMPYAFHLGAEVLEGLYKKLHPCQITGAKILYKEGKGPSNWGKIIIFDESMPISNGFEFLKKAFREGNNADSSYVLDLYPNGFMHFNEAVLNRYIPNLSIKGIIGQGNHSTAFLTVDNNVLKLSTKPNFPSKEQFIPGVEVPIYERFIARLPENNTVYGVLEALAEPANIRWAESNPSDMKKFLEYWANLDERLRQKTNYKFSSDFSSRHKTMRQMGIIREKPYLIDHECISGRHLVL